MEQLITCINCPIGCRMTVNVENGEVVSVTGNSCKRGVTYAAQESLSPKRMITAVVAVAGRSIPLSVKTREPIPKALLTKGMGEIAALAITPPVRMGDVVLSNLCGTGIDVIATKTLK